MGCCLSHILDYGLDNPNMKQLESMIVFANAAASLVTTKKGALLSMPEKKDVLALISGMR
jgi:fructokinase